MFSSGVWWRSTLSLGAETLDSNSAPCSRIFWPRFHPWFLHWLFRELRGPLWHGLGSMLLIYLRIRLRPAALHSKRYDAKLLYNVLGV